MDAMEQQLLLEAATILVDTTTYDNVELQATAVSKLIALGGDRLRGQLATQFCRTHVQCEHNSLELYARLIALIQDETFCDQIVMESVKVMTEILGANVADEEMKVQRLGTFINLMNELANANNCKEVQYHAYEYSSPPREYSPQYYNENYYYAMYHQFSPPPPSYYHPVFFYAPVYFYHLL